MSQKPNTGIEAIDLMLWSEPRTVQTQRGARILRTCPPDALFWDAWREHKPKLQALGFSCAKKGGGWEACWWQAATEVAAEERKPKPKTMAELSRAEDANIDVPVPIGMQMRGYQKAGVAFALRAFGRLNNQGDIVPREGGFPLRGCLIGDAMGL